MLRLDGSMTPLTVLLVACLALAACGGPGGQDGAGQPGDGEMSDPTAPGGGGDTSGGGGASGGSTDGPIRVTVDGTTYGYPVGRCEIIDEVVYVTAITEDATGAVDATLPPWDRDIAYPQRDGGIDVSQSGPDGSGFNLEASRSAAGSAWEWTVSGSHVEITATMANLPMALSQEVAPGLGEYAEVTIDIQCSGGPFGSGPYAAQFATQEVFPIEPLLVRVPGGVTIELAGNEYQITYLVHCQFFAESVSVEGTANDAHVYLYSEGAGIHLDLLIGDRRAEEDGMRWSLPPEASLMDDFLFTGSDTVRSWSGAIVAADGSEADATITVECADGDAFQSAGTATLELDGTTYVLDQVTACSIDGTEIDFFGHATDGDVSLVVTGGGSQVLLGDETGGQTATFDVEFDVSGQRATWSGVLARDRRATIAIDCG